MDNYGTESSRIDTSVFKGHSSRSAASSGAELAGASITDILRMGSWSNETVWQKYYDKPVLTPEASFQRKLLSDNKYGFEQRMVDWVPVVLKRLGWK